MMVNENGDAAVPGGNTLVPPMTKLTSPVRRILITRMKFIGDIILTTPVIRAVRHASPDAFIAYLGEARAVSLLEENPHLNEIIGFDFSRPTILEQARVALLLRRRKFDLVIDLFGNPRSALLTYLSGARIRVGLDRKGRGRLYTVRVADDGTARNAIEFHSQFPAAVGIPPLDARTEIVLTEKERTDAGLMLRSLTGPRDPSTPLIGIHPGATWPAKRWPADRFAKLADHLARELRAQVVVVAGPGDGDAVRAMVSEATTRHVVLPVLSLRRLAAVISLCNVFVGNDAGPMHMSVAVGTPTIGLFGPGEEQIWFPYSAADGHQALRKDVPCHPCHLDFCNRKGEGFMECMKLLSENDVFQAVTSAPVKRSRNSLR